MGDYLPLSGSSGVEPKLEVLGQSRIALIVTELAITRYQAQYAITSIFCLEVSGPKDQVDRVPDGHLTLYEETFEKA